MPGTIRRGKAAIDEAQKSSGRGGDFKPFLKSIFWKEDGEERYLLILNPVDQSPQFDMIEFIPTERGYPEMAVAKTDPYFDEKTDSFVKEWDATPRLKNVAIAVELEPIVEVVGGRRKAKGFEVKTEEFSRKVVDEETGEATDETEDVIAPVIGVVTQSPKNFFNVLRSCDDTDWPVHETPVRVKRIGKDSNTTYQIDGYDTIEPDLTNLLEYVDGIGYLGEDLDDVLEKIDGLEPLEAAGVIGEVLLDKRCEEILDPERYEELFSEVNESMDKFGNSKKKSEKKGATKASRPSQRRSKAAAEEPEDEPAQEKEEVNADSPREDRLAALRKRTAAKKEKKAKAKAA
jgi:hypothetical protein